MKKSISKSALSLALLIAILAVGPLSANETEDWKSLKRESKRMKINETAQEALDTVLGGNAKATINTSAHGSHPDDCHLRLRRRGQLWTPTTGWASSCCRPWRPSCSTAP